MRDEIIYLLKCVVVGAVLFGLAGAILAFLVPVEYTGKIVTLFAATGGLVGLGLAYND